jgi:single-stranded-DNA-specific exonuclease
MLEALALASLGTVADVVPLVRENRILAKHGLRSLPHVESPGIRALLRLARIDGREIDPGDIAFRIGPRLNAAGRMGKVEIALDLLTTESRSLALAAGNRLEEENSRRREVERGIAEECRARLRASTEPRLPAGLVLGGEGWHKGVIGIVAAKIAEEHYRPTILVAFDGERGRGSARSVPGVSILEAIRSCGSHLRTFGGHAHAAGLEIDRARFDDFAREFAGSVVRLQGEDSPGPALAVDAELPLASVDRPLLRELSRLAPHGERNREPVFVAGGARVAGPPRTMGRDHDHLQVLLTQGGATLRAVGFRMGSHAGDLREGASVDVAFTPRLNRWNGRETVEVLLRDIRG